MAKNNLPHIPLYIGDWEKDCNVLSLESEGAWLRIIFKMFSKGKQSTIKIPTKSLQNLWRCSAESVQEIIDDLTFNDICDIDVEGNFTEFTCRRFVKENKLSKTRSEARKKGYEKNKTTTKPNQNKNKKLQNADNDNDNDNDINNNIDIPNKKEFLEFAKSKIENIDLEDVGLKYEAWKSSDWHTGGVKPRKIKNWKTTLLNTLPHLKKTTVKKTGKLNAYNPNRK